MDCQRCLGQDNLVKCTQCNYIFCTDCDSLIHIGKFEAHDRCLINESLQLVVQKLEKYIEDQLLNVENYFNSMIELCKQQKHNLKEIINQYRSVQLKKIEENQQFKEFILPSNENLKDLIKQIDFIKPPLSPRRITQPTGTSQRRSQSCRKLEAVEDKVVYCGKGEKRKFVSTVSQATGIQLKWNPTLEQCTYILEFSIGMRVQGIEQFQQVYKGDKNEYTLLGLQAKTNYRFRVRVEGGEVSEIISVKTQDQPSIEDSQIISKKVLNSEIQLQFERPGIVLGSNAIYFGKMSWEVKLVINGLLEDLTASVVIGVANKQRKITGCTVNYGYQRENVIIKDNVDYFKDGLREIQCWDWSISSILEQEQRMQIINIIYLMNKKELRKLNILVDKEVLNLTGGLYPIQILNQSRAQNHREWVQENILLNNPHISNIRVWVPSDEQNKIFPGEKYNIQEGITLTKEEVQETEDWSYEETVELFEKLKEYNYNFIILHDRQDKRDIYQLKERYYTVMKQVLAARGMVTHPLYNYRYDAEYDRFRNGELEKYLKRTKAVNEEEKRIMEELRKIDQQIRKQEREHKSLTKCMNIQQEIEDLDENQIEHVIEMYDKGQKVQQTMSERIVYLRSRWINDSLPIPPQVQKKLENQLKDLLQSYNKFVLNEEYETIYNKLRQVQLAYMSQCRLEKKRESDKKQLEEKLEKLKKAKMQIESEQKKK